MTMKPKAWVDSMLVAFVDDELDPGQRAAVEQAIQSDPEAQAIVSVLKNSAAAAKTAFDEPMNAPVPRRLLDAVNAGAERSAAPPAAGVGEPFERRRSAPQWHRALLPLAASLAALAIGFGAGVVSSSDRGDVVPTGSNANSAQTKFEEALYRALELSDLGVRLDYQDATSGVSGSVTVIGQVATTFDSSCREFQHTVVDTSVRTENGLACRGANDAWQVLTVPSERPS
ncbi:MAG: hypothetical protein ACREEE_12310 [Dongiaceae bacterium]